MLFETIYGVDNTFVFSLIAQSIMNTESLETSHEGKLVTHVFSSAGDAIVYVAKEIAQLIREKDQRGEPTVLGLATGSTPVKLYQELIRLHKEEGLSFQNVVSFNLDEYCGLPPEDPQSYRYFMQQQLFDHVDIKAGNTYVPDGLVELSQMEEYCQGYEEKIQALGGIDIQLLGIGRTGHIGFNEPPSARDSRTRMVVLDPVTREDAVMYFGQLNDVPTQAITMGVGTILEAKKVFMLAWGDAKAPIVKQAVLGDLDENVPATFLQLHDQCEYCIDSAAAAELKSV